jgi:hypothetical protein
MALAKLLKQGHTFFSLKEEGRKNAPEEENNHGYSRNN